MVKNKNLKNMSLSVESEEHILLKQSARKLGWSVSRLIRELVNKYLDLLVNDGEEIPVIIRIPGDLKEDPDALRAWLNSKIDALVKALS